MTPTSSDHTDRAPETGRDWFAWLIDPLPVAEFERDYLQQRHVHIRREAASYYAELLSVADLDVVLGTHWIGHGDREQARDGEVELARDGDFIPAKAYTNRAGRILPLEVASQFDNGATVIFKWLHQRVPAQARLCAALAGRFRSPTHTTAYLTPPDAQGFGPHQDSHDVFVLQVRGAKRWSIYDTRVRLPLDSQFNKRGTPPGDVIDEFELGPGSALYLPRGLIHSARSTGEVSLHITLGIQTFTWAQFLAESVAAGALEEESLRVSLPRELGGEGWPDADGQRLFREKLALVQSRFDLAAVWRPFADEVLATNTPLFTDLFSQRLCGDRLTLGSRVRRRAGLLVEAATEGKTCRLRFCGRELRLPAFLWPALQFALTADGEFAVGDLPDCLGHPAGRLTLAARLVREGVLQRCPGSSRAAR